MFRFREICEIKPEEKGLGFDPDKRIDPDEQRIKNIVRQAQQMADEAWNEFDPDKRIEV